MTILWRFTKSSADELLAADHWARSSIRLSVRGSDRSKMYSSGHNVSSWCRIARNSLAKSRERLALTCTRRQRARSCVTLRPIRRAHASTVRMSSVDSRMARIARVQRRAACGTSGISVVGRENPEFVQAEYSERFSTFMVNQRAIRSGRDGLDLPHFRRLIKSGDSFSEFCAQGSGELASGVRLYV
jgi:hypothetical protein